MKLRQYLKKQIVPEAIEHQVDRLRKTTGSLGHDPWGFQEDAAKIGMTLVRPVHDRWFRVDSRGEDNVPPEGPVLLVANHSGQLPLDGLMIGYTIANRGRNPRLPRAMIERFFPTVPWLGNLLNQVGAVLGDPANCARMLENGEAIIVFPEGIRGSGKPYRERYQLKRFGSGFMRLAMEHNATVVPVGVVGCEETMPAFGNIRPLARWLGVPYVPVAAPVVLPSRVLLRFGEPMRFEPATEMTEEALARHVDQVRNAISNLIDQGLSERERVF
ncbi:lysophospholipid acyltransferase family protein [Salicola sp. Rm-C-2C1-2]|uniref:lysophospholipid acyltransferase family protein n=1 Tax=Salicola sp. Rm-C-2C1-2 TaxID=3141321 RepID=UPI0032E4A31C